MNAYFLVAGILSFAIALIHVIGGGKTIIEPINASDGLHPVVLHTNYYAWHIVTICLFVMAGAFGWSALDGMAWEAAALGSMLAAAFCIFGFVLVPLKRQRFRDMPQAWFFLPVALLGLYGFYG